MSPLMHRVCWAAAIACAGACATPRPGDGAPAAANAQAATDAPVLASITPDTVPLGRQEIPTLVLRGTGFVPGGGEGFATGGNIVRVGPAVLERMGADAEGRTIRFMLPLSYVDSTVRGRPAAFVPGDYPVVVVTPAGTSNALTLTMIR